MFHDPQEVTVPMWIRPWGLLRRALMSGEPGITKKIMEFLQLAGFTRVRARVPKSMEAARERTLQRRTQSTLGNWRLQACRVRKTEKRANPML